MGKEKNVCVCVREKEREQERERERKRGRVEKKIGSTGTCIYTCERMWLPFPM